MLKSTRSTLLSVAGLATAAATVGIALASPGTSHGSAGVTAARSRTTSHAAIGHGAHAGSAPSAGPAPDGSNQTSGRARLEVGGSQLASNGIVVNYPPGASNPRIAPRLPNVPASAYVIADAGSGQVLAAKDPHGQYPPASTLKVLTAITMIPRLNPNATVVATKLAASVEPNIVGLIPGRSYKVADLFRALLLVSANDAAVSLVQAAGSFDQGMALINAEAHHLQAYDVLAILPNGLPATGQVVSAYDLALIASQGLAMPAFMQYDSTLTATFPLTARRKVALVNQNYLLTQYNGGIGGKIGWTRVAGATYIGMARRNGTTLIVTILHATPLTEITSAEKLLDWGFAMDGHVKPVGTLVPPLPPSHPRVSTKSGHHLALASSLSAGRHGVSMGVVLTASLVAALSVCVVAVYTLRRRRMTRPR